MLGGIIFDLDGVICGTDAYHYAAWKETLAEIGVEVSSSTMDRLRGKSRMEGLELVLLEAGVCLSEEQKLAVADKKNARYRELLNGMTESDVLPATRAALVQMREWGLRLAIGSSSKNAKLVLEKIGLGSFFDAVSDGVGLKAAKPDPEVFLRAAHMLGLKPCECLVMEDARSGIDAAKRGGFTAVGIGDAAGYEATDYPVSAFEDILEVIRTVRRQQA